MADAIPVNSTEEALKTKAKGGKTTEKPEAEYPFSQKGGAELSNHKAVREDH